jgi:hypothetical protein
VEARQFLFSQFANDAIEKIKHRHDHHHGGNNTGDLPPDGRGQKHRPVRPAAIDLPAATDRAPGQIISGIILMAPQGHSAAQMPQPLQ